MSVTGIGYGMGKKDFKAANCVRVMLGNKEDSSDKVIGLSCNVDDMTGEDIGFAIERLFAAGAKDVFTIPIGMKKSRPGIMLCVICSEQKMENMTDLIFRYTTTIGIRKTVYERFVLDRINKEVETKYGKVRIKVSEGYGVKRMKAEYEDIGKIADDNSMTLDEVRSSVLNDLT